MSGTVTTKTSKIYYVHVCSKCGNVTVQDVSITSRVHISGIVTNSSIEKHMSDLRTNTINRISTEGGFPVGPVSRFVNGGANISVRFSNGAVGCPVCGNIEEWQRGHCDVNTIPQECLPMFFPTPEMASDRALSLCMQRQICGIQPKCDGKDNVDDILKLLNTASADIVSAPEKSGISTAFVNGKELKKELDSLGFFDFSKKKELKKKIENSEKNYSDEKNKLISVLGVSYRKRNDLRSSLLDLSVRDEGFDGTIVKYPYGTSYSYRPANTNCCKLFQGLSSEKICKGCGAHNFLESRFCSQCGTGLDG